VDGDVAEATSALSRVKIEALGSMHPEWFLFFSRPKGVKLALIWHDDRNVLR
jgi:hypothetical protein